VKERAHASVVALIAILVSSLSLTQPIDGYWTGCSLHSGKAAPNARENERKDLYAIPYTAPLGLVGSCRLQRLRAREPGTRAVIDHVCDPGANRGRRAVALHDHHHGRSYAVAGLSFHRTNVSGPRRPADAVGSPGHSPMAPGWSVAVLTREMTQADLPRKAVDVIAGFTTSHLRARTSAAGGPST
jgi:hypothetical protein